jgi:hypothetical protein
MAARPGVGQYPPPFSAHGLVVVPVLVTHPGSMTSRLPACAPGHRPGARRAEGAPLNPHRELSQHPRADPLSTCPDRLFLRGRAMEVHVAERFDATHRDINELHFVVIGAYVADCFISAPRLPR